jgi:gephyrin
VERIAAGVIPTQALTSGTVSYITTGSPVPDGADAVVKIEDTEAVDASIDNTHQEKSVRILVGVKAGQNIRPIGSDIVAGEKLLQPGDIITSAEIGLLATVCLIYSILNQSVTNTYLHL